MPKMSVLFSQNKYQRDCLEIGQTCPDKQFSLNICILQTNIGQFLFTMQIKGHTEREVLFNAHIL